MRHCFTILLLTTVVALGRFAWAGEASAGKTESRWTVEKARQWYDKQPWIVGCDFLPSTAINQVEMFQPGTYDPDTIRRELGWAKGLGFNTLRVYLHDILWKEEVRAEFLKNFDDFLDICQSLGIRCIIVFFDDCHWDHTIKLGGQQPRITGVHNSGWLQSPGRSLLKSYRDQTISSADKARLKGYVQGILKLHGDDPRILMWDVYNEPQPHHGTPHPLLADAWSWAREMNPSQPLTGCTFGSGADFGNLQGANSDIISYHCYSDGRQAEWIDVLRGKYPGRPIVCTEYMGRPMSTFQKSLPVLKKNHVGAINWGLVNGKSGTVWQWPSQQPIAKIVSREGWSMTEIETQHGFDQPAPSENYPEPKKWFHDIFRVDGTPFDEKEITFIKQIVGPRE